MSAVLQRIRAPDLAGADAFLEAVFPARRIRRVLLVVPPDGPEELFNVETARRGRYPNYPPYGLMLLAAALREAGIEPRILNLNDAILRAAQKSSFNFDLEWRSRLLAAISTFAPDLVCATCMFTMTHQSLRAVCQAVHAVPVAVGGVAVSNDVDRVLADLGVEFAFVGEGDDALPAFCRVVNQELGSDALQQVVFGNGERFNVKARPANIDRMPAYDLIDIDSYSASGTVGAFYCFKPRGSKFATVLSNRGCRAQCTFCSVRNFNGVGVRQRSISSVVDELELLRSCGIEHVMWLDDDLYKDERRFIALADEIVRRNVGITWDATNGVIAYSCTEDVIAASEASGCIAVNIGMESGNRTILKQVKKPGTVENFLAAAEVFRRHPKIHTSVFLMVGFPNETWGMVQDTIHVAEEMDCDWYRISQLQPLPNTPIYDAMVAQGLIAPVGDKDLRFMGGGYGKQAAIEAGKVAAADTAMPSDDEIPTPAQLERIWFLMNYRLNFARVPRETRPEKREQLRLHLHSLADVISPENALALHYLQGLESEAARPALAARLAERLASSPYWRERFTELGLPC